MLYEVITGRGEEAGVNIGPMISESAVQKVEELLEDAVDRFSSQASATGEQVADPDPESRAEQRVDGDSPAAFAQRGNRVP